MIEISADWVAALATVAYVIFTVFILLSNYKTNKLTQQQVEAYNKQLSEEHRPIVTLSLVADGALALLRIRNEGNRIAENVRISHIQTVEYTGEETIHFTEHLEEMCASTLTLASGTQWDLIVCVTWNLKYIQPSEVEFQISYSCNEKEYKSTTIIRFGSFTWARSYRDDPVKELENIKKEIHGCKTELHNINSKMEKRDENNQQYWNDE